MNLSNKSACSFLNCSSTTKDLFFKFPAKEIEGMAWLKAINNDELSRLTYSEIIKQRRGVCFKHFPETAILLLSSGKRILKKGFLPTENLNSEVSIQKPGNENALYVKKILLNSDIC